MAKQTNDTIWTGIVSGNMGQLFYAQGKYDTAYKLLKMDYEASNETGFYDNAAHSLQWAARTNLARGNTLQALTEVRRAFELLRLWPDPYYLRNTYSTCDLFSLFRVLILYLLISSFNLALEMARLLVATTLSIESLSTE